MEEATRGKPNLSMEAVDHFCNYAGEFAFRKIGLRAARSVFLQIFIAVEGGIAALEHVAEMGTAIQKLRHALAP